MSDADTHPSGLREEKGGPRGPGRELGAALLRVLVALGLLGVVYTGVAFYFKDRPQAGVSVAGVDVGSMTIDEAKARVEREVAPRLAEPVTITVSPAGVDGAQAEELTLVPQEAGLGFDLDASLDGVTGLSFNPRVLWSHVTGSPRDLPLVGTVDTETLNAAVQALADDFDSEPIEGEVTLSEEGVSVVDSSSGRALEVEETAQQVADAWPERTSVQGSAERLDPLLPLAEVERFTTQEVEPALAGPVNVTATWDEDEDDDEDAETVTASLQPREIVSLLSVERAADHTLSLHIDDEALLARLRQDLGQLERGPRDATVRLAGTQVRTVPARTGAELDEEPLVEAARAAILATGEDRDIEAQLLPIEPEIPTAAARGWTFEEMGSFTSPYPTGPGDDARTHNLQTGADHVNGTVVMPGEQFSLASALGDISTAAGYVEAPVIMDGRLVMGLGGGLSQISTVVFNASWFSGVQLDQHTPHSFYIARYPAGREATIAVPVLDNRWTNNTDNPIVVRSWTEDDALHMVYLGDMVYEVETIDGQWRDIVEPERTTDDSPECVPQSPAQGFTITNVRVLHLDGEAVHRDQFTTTYIPADEIVCTGAGGR